MTEETTNEELDLIDKANEAAERMKQQNELMDKNIERLQKLKIQNTLSGSAEAGNNKKAETNEEYTDRIMKGQFDEE